MKSNATSLNILIVDDELEIKNMLRIFLERENYNIFDCETAEQALKILNEKQVHIILLDWMLPKSSGIEFTKLIRNNDKLSTIPIILLTAKSEEDDKLLAFNSGVDDYLPKPFSFC